MFRMLWRLIGGILKLFIFLCIVLYTLFVLNAMFDLRENLPIVNDILAAIAQIPLFGEPLGNIVILVIAILLSRGAFDD